MPPHHIKVPGPRGWRGWRWGGCARAWGLDPPSPAPQPPARAVPLTLVSVMHSKDFVRYSLTVTGHCSGAPPLSGLQWCPPPYQTWA